MKPRHVALAAVMLVALQVILALLSWLLPAAGLLHWRPLLAPEGLRWFFGHFADGLLSPLLVWLLLLAMAYGCLKSACRGLPNARHQPNADARTLAQARRLALLVVAAYVILLLGLTLVPHAVLLSATGRLMPSPLSRALVPATAFGIVLGAAAYGFARRSFRSPADLVSAMTNGLSGAAPLLLIYVLFMQFYMSLRYVLG